MLAAIYEQIYRVLTTYSAHKLHLELMVWFVICHMLADASAASQKVRMALTSLAVLVCCIYWFGVKYEHPIPSLALVHHAECLGPSAAISTTPTIDELYITNQDDTN